MRKRLSKLSQMPLAVQLSRTLGEQVRWLELVKDARLAMTTLEIRSDVSAAGEYLAAVGGLAPFGVWSDSWLHPAAGCSCFALELCLLCHIRCLWTVQGSKIAECMAHVALAGPSDAPRRGSRFVSTCCRAEVERTVGRVRESFRERGHCPARWRMPHSGSNLRGRQLCC